MNKSGTPKKKLHNDYLKPYRNKKRPSVKINALNAGYIQQWISKDQKIADFVNIAVEALHREKEKDKRVADYMKMQESVTYQQNEKLKEDVDNLIRGQNRSDSNINELRVELRHVVEQVKYFQEEYEDEEKNLDAPIGKKAHKEFEAEFPKEAKLLDQIAKLQEDREKQVWGKEYKSHKEDMKRIGKKLKQQRKDKRKKLFK